MMPVSRVERCVKRSGKVFSIDPNDSVVAAASKMSEQQIGCLVVLGDDNSVVGIITERDVLGKVVAKALNPAKTTVGEIMVQNVHSCTRDTDLVQAERTMAQQGIRHLPIIENGLPLGMISSRDIMAHKLLAAQSAMRRQSRILQNLEFQHPGITRLETDSAGRIIM